MDALEAVTRAMHHRLIVQIQLAALRTADTIRPWNSQGAHAFEIFEKQMQRFAEELRNEPI